MDTNWIFIEQAKTLTGVTLEEAYKRLREPFPAEALSRRPGAANLTGLEQIYVVERLNEVFGPVGIGWKFEFDPPVVHAPTKEGGAPSLSILLRLSYNYRNFSNGIATSSFIWAYGHQLQQKGMGPGDAMKSVVSDALKKAASYLGCGIQLFKGQQTLDDPLMVEAWLKEARDAVKGLPAEVVQNIMSIACLSKDTMRDATSDQRAIFFEAVDNHKTSKGAK